MRKLTRKKEAISRLHGKTDCIKGITCISNSLPYLKGYAEQYALEQQLDHKTSYQDNGNLAQLL
jgi:hypothetical protein